MYYLDIFDDGFSVNGRCVTFHISYEDGARFYTGGRRVYYGCSWQEIVKMIRERARKLTGQKKFHTTCYR